MKQPVLANKVSKSGLAALLRCSAVSLAWSAETCVARAKGAGDDDPSLRTAEGAVPHPPSSANKAPSPATASSQPQKQALPPRFTVFAQLARRTAQKTPSCASGSS